MSGGSARSSSARDISADDLAAVEVGTGDAMTEEEEEVALEGELPEAAGDDVPRSAIGLRRGRVGASSRSGTHRLKRFAQSA